MLEKIAQTMVLGLALVSLFGCQEEVIENDDPTNLELLTSDPWTLHAYGFDLNENNVLDSCEDLIEKCQKDNTYFFESTGVGTFSENGLLCENEISKEFEWRFLSQETQISIGFQCFSILRLVKHELILIPKVEPQFIIQYKR